MAAALLGQLLNWPDAAITAAISNARVTAFGIFVAANHGVFPRDFAMRQLAGVVAGAAPAPPPGLGLVRGEGGWAARALTGRTVGPGHWPAFSPPLIVPAFQSASSSEAGDAIPDLGAATYLVLKLARAGLVSSASGHAQRRVAEAAPHRHLRWPASGAACRVRRLGSRHRPRGGGGSRRYSLRRPRGP